MEVRRHEASAVGEHLARGLVHGGVRGVLLLVHAAVDLAAHVREEVEGATRLPRGERIRARGDSLRFQHLGGPVVGNLGRDHSVEVLLELDDVDCPEAPADAVDLNRAAISTSEP
jgi:hypothetical protein